MFVCSQNAHVFTLNDSQKIDQAIINKKLNPKIYLTQTQLADPTGPNMNMDYYQSCGYELSTNFFAQVALGTDQAWRAYEISKFTEPVSSITQTEFEKLHSDFRRSIPN